MRQPQKFTRKTEPWEAGFSLVELLIVVAIILIICAIAIPNFIRSRMAANEAAAVSSVRAVTTAAVVYSTTYGNGYPPSLDAMGPPSSGGNADCDTADLLDPNIATPPYQKSGYTFAYTGSNPATAAGGCTTPGFNSYLVTGTPNSIGVTGTRSFCSDEPAELFYDVSGATTASESACEALPPLQ